MKNTLLTAAIILAVMSMIFVYGIWDKVNIINESVLYHYNTTHAAENATTFELECDDESCNDFYGVLQPNGSIKIIDGE